MNLRKASIGDLPSIRDIYNEAIRNTTAVYEYEEFTDAYMKSWFIEKTEKKNPILVMESEGEVAGFATYGTFRQRAAYQFTAEHSLYVHASFQRQGIGKQLLISIMEEAKSNKIHTLIGGIDASNIVSLAMHKEAGFIQSGLIKEAAFKFDRWLDLVFMQKIL